jgi:hypothetical protein
LLKRTAWVSGVKLAQILRLSRLLRGLLLLLLLLVVLLLFQRARLLGLARLLRLRGAHSLLRLRRLLLWPLLMLEVLLPLVLWLTRLVLWLSCGRPWFLIQSSGGRTRAACLGECPLALDWPVSFRGVYLRRLGRWVGTRSVALRRGHLSLGGSVSLRVGSRIGAAMETFLPAATLALMVLIIEILVITLTHIVVAPIGIPLGKSLHILRALVIPGGPLRPVPVGCSDNVGRRISVIRSPTILRAKKVVEQSIIKPVPII